MKLHGSLDTFLVRDGKDYIKLKPLNASAAGVVEMLEAVNQQLPFSFPQAPHVGPSNEIMYLDGLGELQFLRRSILTGVYKFPLTPEIQSEQKTMMTHFRSYLNYVNRLVVIGYSFGDLHVNIAIRSWLEFSSDCKVEIVDPAISHVPLVLAHMTDQVTIHLETASEYLRRYHKGPRVAEGLTKLYTEVLAHRASEWRAKGRQAYPAAY